MRKPKLIVLTLLLLLGSITYSAGVGNSEMIVTISDLSKTSKIDEHEFLKPLETDYFVRNSITDDLPHIIVVPDTFEYWDIEVGDIGTHIFELINDGGSIASVNIPETFPMDDVFYISEFGSVSIDVGESYFIEITFSPNEIGFYSTVIPITGSGDCNDIDINISGECVPGAPNIFVNPNTYDYGDIELYESATYTFNLINIGESTADVYIPEVTGYDFEFQVSGHGNISVPAGGSYAFDITFQPILETGFFSSILHLTGSGECNDFDINLSGHCVPNGPEIYVGPDTYDYGDVLLYESAIYTFYLMNNGGTTGDVYIPEFTGYDFEFQVSDHGNVSIPPGGSYPFDITFYPVETGYYSSILHLTGSGDCNDFDINLSGHCVPNDFPYITITPENYNYDTVLMNTCSDAIPFIVKNIGGEIATGYFNIGNFLQYSVSPPPGSFTINPGDSMTVYVQYCPVSLDGTGNTLTFTGTGTTNSVSSSQIGWTYCKKIITVANPPEGGTTTPQTQFIFDTYYYKCVDATANPGYEFVNWEHDGIEVSTNPHYCADYYGTCVFEPYLLTANFQVVPQPLISIVPQSHDFGDVQLFGNTDDFTFEIRNIGGATAEIYVPGQTSNYPDFSISDGNGSFFIEPDSSHYFTVNFWPFETLGLKTAFIAIDGIDDCNNDTAYVQGMSVFNVDVTTEVSPVGAGQTYGDGIYSAYDTCCVSAIPNDGYIFDIWEEVHYIGYGTTTPEYCYRIEPISGYDFNHWIGVFKRIEFQFKAYLSGCFNVTNMNVYPNQGEIPLSQPFNIPPWNYDGAENVGSLPNNNITDWILVELRDAPNASAAVSNAMVDRMAAFILNDGSIVGMDGSSNLQFITNPNQNLFVVIWHRNHLGVISSQPLIEVQGVYSYDFTTGENNALGDSLAQKELAPGVWGMIGADGDANGTIDMADKNSPWAEHTGESGYKAGDFNMNGNVDNEDKNEIWLTSLGYSSQLPIETFSCGDQLYDSRDGQSYATVEIGVQCWMAENLNVGNRTDFTIGQQDNDIIEKFCFNNEDDSCSVYGGIYQWDELMEYISTEGSQGICPEGWHVPTDGEWCVLENEVDSGTIPCGSEGWRGIDAGGNLKETGFIHWSQPNAGATNSSNFTGLAAGYFSTGGNAIVGLGLYSQYWTSTESSTGNPWMRGLHYSKTTIRRINQSKDYGLSIRCIKD